ncbi:TonB-dependent receptor plug domain-containing protein [Sphingomonas desiccabilis]|uniref:TonB-dependent receptor plug domain-containing protein n=1 Tax=Sphingomonas desiccabilis TaxID=429134 RepID=UPI00185A826D|nr:TonB-dependent receptor plug domain-containing protein [Sphingomonas desiccabilis]MBB3909771.1 outer membrane receptor protein involved in Fe transport [Sphingomonas desiccabilis]
MAALVSMPAAAQVAADTGDVSTQDAPVAIGDPVASAKLAAEDVRADNRADTGGEVVVTGTRIQRPNNRSAAPIVTTTSAEIAAQGATTIEEVLNRLPQVQANSEQNFSDSEGRQRIKLRSLGYERTLMLIDGLRIGLPNTVDVGIIPTALVDRIDVLTGGASSVYGSDAVSGVVNFILKKNFEGVRLDANYSFFNHNNRESAVTEAASRIGVTAPSGMTNDGGRADISLSAGTNLFDDRVNITGFVNYRQSDLVRLRDRSGAVCEVVQTSNTAPLACSRASFTPAGTIIPQAGAYAGQVLVNNPNGNGTFIPINSGPVAAQANPYDDWSFQRPFDRINAGGFITAQINDHIEFYGNGLYYKDKSYNTQLNRTFNFGAYGSTPFQVNCDNPFLSASQAQVLCGANAGVAGQYAPIDVRYRFDGLPSVQQKFTNEGYRIVAGLRGRVLDDVWSYDVAGMISRARLDSIDTPFAQFESINNSLDVVNVGGTPTCRSVVNGSDPACVPFNAFAPFNQDLALNNYLYGGATGGIYTRIPRLLQFLGTVSGDLGKYGITSPFAEQGIAIAIGAEYREEMERSIVNDIFRENNGYGENQRVTQNILEGNVEVQAPLVENQSWTQLLQLNAGYRQSKYNRLDGSFGTWKVEGIWAPIEDITFRASYNKSQAAPGVGAAAGAANVFWNQGFYADPCAPRVDPSNPNGPRLAPSASLAQCRNTGLADNLYGSATLICPDDRCTVREGGFGLTPESAFTKTFGVVLRPRFLPGLTVSIDRWLIDLEDQLTFLNPADWINECLTTGNDYFCRGIVRNPDGTLSSSPAGSPATGWVSRGSVNGYKSQSHGWDFQGQYNLGLGNVGFLDMSFNGTLMTLVGTQGAPTVEPRDCTGYWGSGCGESMPTWQHQFRTTWTSSDRVASISLNWRHRSAMPLTFYSPEDTGIPRQDESARRDQYAGIKAYDWFDVAFTFDINKKMTFRLAANNIFDRDPPIVPDSRAQIGLLRGNTIMGYDLLGRQIVAGVSLRM